MTADSAARIITLADRPGPNVAASAFVAPGAVLVGHVTLAEHASVWYNSVLRAEAEPIRIGAGSNLQDNVSCHVDHGFPLIVGRNVSVGHGAVLHGCTIEDDVLVGMSATILNGAVIGEGSLVAAGAVVLEGSMVPPRSLVAGVPAKVRRALTDDEVAGIRHNAEAYLEHSVLHEASLAAPQD
ncbi:gamma carbonic anhydrase family protein [Cryobacterium sp. PH31-AA6]|uniref:gamma carbonic anhydrase family protein n=1 Tax=Cryobacterium sp. PH31-AA6 TaxID=3046205 RepID=UPI0024BB2033|nr:gamma carbonic anhydrase family protein [Cryobacterium sp. PH31-AA6]MDJ0325236.1 gamma carbonic anhydrase family protein [Cryobacterium sp. PH31-AA6]